jgi:hypothetical protein
MRSKHRIRQATLLLSTGVLLLSVLPLAAGPAEVGGTPEPAGWSIVATYPVPEGASGLAYDGTYLYCGIYGVNGGEVYQIDPATGAYSLMFTGPQGDAFGLTFDGTYLWTTDHPGPSGDPALAMQLDWDGTVITQIELPAHYMSGIAYDEGNYWVSRYYPDPGHIYLVDPAGTILKEFDAPDNQPWDLCVENDNLWVADYWGDTLYQIDNKTGALLDSHPSEGVDPAGIVWDGSYLWYCDNGEGGVDFLYKVDLGGGGTPQINVPVTAHDYGAITIGDSATWNMTVQNTGDADLTITGVSFAPTDDLSCPIMFPVVIAPGGNDVLPIVFAPDDFGALNAVVTVLSSDPIHPEVDVDLSGDGVYAGPYIHLTQSTHNYGLVRTNATTRWFMEIVNRGDELLIIDDIAVDDAHFYVGDSLTLPIQIGTLGSVDIPVWFQPEEDVPYSATLSVSSNDPVQDPADATLLGTGLLAQYPMGSELWSYDIDTSFDNSPKAMAAIPDVSGDGIADVIVCSEDDFVRCFNGNAHGTGDVLWAHEISGGSVYRQAGLQITEDVDGDGYDDVVVGAAWGAKLIRAISGLTGQTIWTHDTHEYGNGGWVYQVDCSFDYNNDGITDVLAVCGDDSDDIGPKRVYCLDGTTGVSIWERPLGGPGFGVLGVVDFTGDGEPDVVAGASNEGETEGRAIGINGVTGAIEWTFVANGSSVWALEQVDDITGDGVRDVVVGDFSGVIYGLDVKNGNVEYTRGGFGIIIGFEPLKDVNGDSHTDILPAHYGTIAQVLDGQTGGIVWATSVADKPSVVAVSRDLNDDGVNDVMVGTLFSSNYAYFLDGVNGDILESLNYGTPIDAIAAIPDVVGDGSWEMVVGGRNGLVTCLSGGVGADCNDNGVPDWMDIAECMGDPACSDCNDNQLPDACDDISGGDFDAEGDVDVDDYAALAACMAGPAEDPTPPAAECVDACLSAFDADMDGDVDMADAALFQAIFTGAAQ